MCWLIPTRDGKERGFPPSPINYLEVPNLELLAHENRSDWPAQVLRISVSLHRPHRGTYCKAINSLQALLLSV